ncbi:MAG: CARDB domain-containing protein [Armatimonadota bacterium]
MRLTIAAVCLTVLCLSALLPVLAAEDGPVVTPARPTGFQLSLPDLVVKQVEISRGAGEFPTYTLKITVANIGRRVAAESKTGVIYYALPRTDQPMVTGILGEVATPTIAAGAETVVTITHNLQVANMYLFVTADFPDSGHQLGAVRELSEQNNVLAVPVDTRASFPRTYR